MSEPKWLELARSKLGMREVKGPKHSAVILEWLSKLRAWWKDDETPWCGTFCAAVLQEAGLPYPKEWFRAKAWADYGSLLRKDRLAPGTILVFDRKGGGHVGFYVGEDDTAYHVLGGNQGDAVTITRIVKGRCIATRWPKGEPVLGKPVWLKANGALSRNEA